MIRETSEFRDIADNARLTAKETDHFVEGMTEGAEDLTLNRESYTLLQAFLERVVLREIGDQAQEPSHVAQPKPFAYATPAVLTPLRIPGHLRSEVAWYMFNHGLAISVVEEGTFRDPIKGNSQERRRFGEVLLDSLLKGEDLFSSTTETIAPPRMAMHFEGSEGAVRVAFLANQVPAQDSGRLVFGDEASAMHQSILGLHQENVTANRSTAWINRVVVGLGH